LSGPLITSSTCGSDAVRFSELTTGGWPESAIAPHGSWPRERQIAQQSVVNAVSTAPRGVTAPGDPAQA
jgi:hypothetical protein